MGEDRQQLALFPGLPDRHFIRIIEHPSRMVRRFGFGPEGKKCKTCKFVYRIEYAKTYIKCKVHYLRGGSEASDIRLKWDACWRYEAGTPRKPLDFPGNSD